MKKSFFWLFAAVGMFCFTGCGNLPTGEKKTGNQDIFSMNRGHDAYFDAFLPPNFYENFAEGKFSRSIYPKFSDRAAWARARKSRYADLILHEAEKIKDGAVPQLLFSDYRKFQKTGDRAGFEQLYFRRRVNIAYLTLALCLTGDKGKYMPRLMDHLVAVMEETTWTVPAHSQWDKTRLLTRKPSALFCCETGAELALVHHLLGKELDREYENFSEQIREKVLERTVYNILFNPESSQMHWWYMIERPNNWTPWCAYNCLICTVLLEQDNAKLARCVREFMRITARFAANYADNGFCEEGPSYYEKSSLNMFAALQLMQKVQPGSMDKLFAVPRIRAMLEFIGKLSMSPTQMLSFGDSQPEFDVALHLLIPCARSLDSKTLRAFCSGKTQKKFRILSDCLHIGLGLLFDCPDGPPHKKERKTEFVCFENRLAITRTGNFAAALKVGNNAEYHNHNDLGHFVLYHNDRPVIVDAGSASYRKINFSDQRYTLWYTRGSGHNAPVFGNVEQLAGVQYAASFVSAAPQKITADLSKAYPASAGVKSFLRTLESSGNAVAVSDDFSLEKPLSATVTLLTPAKVRIIGKNRLMIGDTVLETENITFDSMEEMPRLELRDRPCVWNCSLTALRFKATGPKYRFVFRPQEVALTQEYR